MKRILSATTLALLAACSRNPDADPKMLAEWVHSLYGAIRVERVSPPVASRLMVYATSALYAGLATTDAKMTPLSGALNGFPELPAPGQRVDGALVGVYAERVVLDSLLREGLPTTRSALTRLADSLATARVALGLGEDVRAASEAHGVAIGNAIVAWSRSDNFDKTRGRKYAAPVGPGLWVNDAPANVYASQNMSGASEMVELSNPANVLQAGKTSDRALVLNRPKRSNATLPVVNMTGMSEPYWAELRPFVLSKWNECVIAPPPAWGRDSSAALYPHAREVFETRRNLTDEQKEIALYWADNAGESGTPVGHWISIASQMVSQRQLPARDAATILVQSAVAMADAFIASWGYKYQFNLIRPRTYIREAIDPTWEPLIPTPPFPEYPSGHSTQSSAAAAVLTAAIGAVPFDDSTSVTIGHKVRRFESFRQAAEEAGMSRIYGGIHFPVGNVSGRELGSCIGNKVVERFGGSSEAGK
ncbi:MAG TPA: vanadium-dependent haloperoxidase [Gemmatimonadaceae bacterium]|nr:vanadium-dependent haloperoxidase [Gemmatimonadaceae bacterium]